MRYHGHSYVLRLELQSDLLTPAGFVEDYRDLEDVKQYVDKVLDHQDLNDVFTPSTAENIACAIYHQFKKAHPRLTAVSISETRKTWATYRPT